MKKQLLRIYRGSAAGKLALGLPRYAYKAITDRFLSDEDWCRNRFKWDQGYPVNLQAPKSLNEKLQYLKLYYQEPELVVHADKYGVRERVRAALGEDVLIPMLAYATDPNQIQFENLPEPFIIKPSHSSGKTIIVKDRAKMNWGDVRTACKGWLKSNFYRACREWHYKDIPPGIIVERLLQDQNGEVPSDFKCHCFNGKVFCVQVDLDRRTNHKRNFYDRNWSLLPFTWSVCVGDTPMWPNGRDVVRPEPLARMLEASDTLAKPFPYVRVDWYIVDGKILFGETTFNHGSGFERIVPTEWDYKLGDMLRLPETLKQRQS